MNDRQKMDELEQENDNCVTPEDPEENSPVNANQTDLDALMRNLDEKNRQMEEVTNRLLRLQADFDNFRRRTRQEKEEASQIITNNIITQLLPVLDNFERALASGASQNAGQLLCGMELVYRQFTQILECFGVTAIVAVGNQFDPNQHEAVMRVEDSSQPEGLVVEELQKGYMAQAKILRPSMVKVVCNS